MKWESVKTSSTPFLRFIDMAFENLPDDLMERITRTISNLHLESRSNIEAQFRTFVELCRSSSTPQMLIVKGEWGEGKTTLLNVYINKLQKEYSAEIISYHTRMDRVLDILEKKLRKNIRLSVHNIFLAAIVEDIANVLKMNGSPLSIQLQKIGEITREEQIFEAIDVLANDHKHLMFFIDEFEAIIGRKNIIINQVEIVQAIIRAIRAIRGGELKRLITNTEVVPHFVFAMTPYAYSEYVHRMGIEFKGWEQRRRYLIELEPVTRKDVETVITHLIKEIYFSKDIDILDLFEDRRYLDILFTISQGNLGSLITAFNLVLAAAKRKHSEVFGTEGMIKINTDLIIEVFTQNKIYTYVGETEGIDRVLYNECTEFLKQNIKDKKCLEIWKKLVATSSVLFEDEVDERDIELLNKVLFNKLGKTVVSKIELYPINNNVEESLVKLLKENNENINKNTLLIALRRIMMGLGTKRYLPLPSCEESAKMSLRDTLSKMLSFSMIINVSSKTLEKMYEILKENSEKNNERILIGYAISQQVRERIYPAPPIFILDFVDPSKALQLWKMAYDSVTDNPTLVEKNVRLLLINKIPEIDIKNQMPVFYYQYGGQIIKLDVEVFVFVYFNKKRLEILEKTIKQGKIAILITKDSIYNTVLTELKKENLHKKSLVIPISEITLIQLAIIQELLQRKRRKELDFRIEEPRLENKLAEIINSLELTNEMNSVINKLRTDGYVLEEFKLVSGKGIDELIDYYFMYLLGGSEFTIKELWREHLKKISNTLLYGRNVRKPVVLKRDIAAKKDEKSEESLRGKIEALKANGFILEENGKIKIQNSIVESRILQILEEYENQGKPDVPIELAKKYFIDMSKVGYDVFSKYLKILEWKGEIRIENNFVRLVNELELNEDLEREYQIFDEKKKKILHLDVVKKNLSFAHIAIFKEHEWRVIDIEQIDSVIEQYLENKYTLTKAQKKLLAEYIDYANNVLLEKILLNVTTINQKSKRIMYDLEEMERDLETITEFCQDFDPEFKIKFISEYETIKSLKDNLKAILSLSKREILNKIKEEYTRSKRTETLNQHPMFYNKNIHNYHLYLLTDIENKVKEFQKDLKKDIKDISEIIYKISSYQQDIEEKKREIKKIEKQYAIKVEIPEIENSYSMSQVMISLRDLYLQLKGILDNVIEPYYKGIDSLSGSINELIKKYREIQKRTREAKKDWQRIKIRSELFERFVVKISSLELTQKKIPKAEIEEIENLLETSKEQLDLAKSELGKIFSDQTYITLIEEKLDKISKYLSTADDKISKNIKGVTEDLKTIINQTNAIVNFLRELQKKSVVEIPDGIVLKYQRIENLLKRTLDILNSEEVILTNIDALGKTLKEILKRRKEIEKFIIKLEKDNLQVKIFRLLLSKPTITLRELIDSLIETFPEEEITKSLLELEKKEIIRSQLSLAK